MSDNKILVGDMSRKQCLEVLKRLLEAMEVFDGISPSPERINALKMAIASLETDEAYQLEYEPTTKNDHHKQNIQAYAHDFGVSEEQAEKELRVTTKNDLGVDAVSRKELLKIYEDRFSELQKLKHLKDNKGAEDRQMGVNYCINILKELPPVTPIRPKGHWIPTYGNVECSACGHTEDARGVGKATHYCSFCGAYMREVVEE